MTPLINVVFYSKFLLNYKINRKLCSSTRNIPFPNQCNSTCCIAWKCDLFFLSLVNACIWRDRGWVFSLIVWKGSSPTATDIGLWAILLAFSLLWMKPLVFVCWFSGWGGWGVGSVKHIPAHILQMSKAQPGLLLTVLNVRCSHPASSDELGRLCLFLVWGWAVTTTVVRLRQSLDQCFFLALKHFLFLQKKQSF